MSTSYRLARLMDAEELTIMSMELYNEVISRKDLKENRVVATIRFYEENANMGEVLMIEYNGVLAGYSMIFRFWSNEYGGLLVGIDELFIRKQFRHNGIASAFVNALINDEKRKPNFVGIELESHPDNKDANRLYMSLGFPKNENTSYIKLFRKK
ncbi:Acetyltransferase (GNAT) family protein [Chitinophaga sp. CF118]|uniref:GNAT family N-acetyltransferase n=1 Tax=Chitinophaga sp. CF118 TaxID=1884367 RepID=UPI0008ECD1EC|nr:GNAT family N-acetyltransferase [Chitinophaga sp. CF118]SFF01583.1 Acetyltransferase (GNAT) family protein [Chitinophaga sp. CF118]